MFSTLMLDVEVDKQAPLDQVLHSGTLAAMGCFAFTETGGMELVLLGTLSWCKSV